MSDYQKKKKFLNLPQYPGGKKAFIEFIKNNLRYPQQALDAKIEGRVLVEFEIDDNGVVHNPWIKKSLGYGCDEEALRVVGLLQYEKVKNRGMRVRVTHKTFINFKLPKTTISYTITPSKKVESVEQKPAHKPNLGYTITLN